MIDTSHMYQNSIIHNMYYMYVHYMYYIIHVLYNACNNPHMPYMYCITHVSDFTLTICTLSLICMYITFIIQCMYYTYRKGMSPKTYVTNRMNE